jgi:hypothetical protein
VSSSSSTANSSVGAATSPAWHNTAGRAAWWSRRGPGRRAEQIPSQQKLQIANLCAQLIRRSKSFTGLLEIKSTDLPRGNGLQGDLTRSVGTLAPPRLAMGQGSSTARGRWRNEAERQGKSKNIDARKKIKLKHRHSGPRVINTITN